MKHSQTIGIIVALLVMYSCSLPWITIESIGRTLNGIDASVNKNFSFGKPIILHSIFCIIAILFFLLKKLWAKRMNIFMCFINLGWALKNLIIFKMCRMGDCPTIHIGLYLLVVFSILMLLMSLLPKIELKKEL